MGRGTGFVVGGFVFAVEEVALMAAVVVVDDDGSVRAISGTASFTTRSMKSAWMPKKPKRR